LNKERNIKPKLSLTFSFWGDWALNSRLYACKTDALTLQPHLQSKLLSHNKTSSTLELPRDLLWVEDIFKIVGDLKECSAKMNKTYEGLPQNQSS
jgi:hypothetical protein